MAILDLVKSILNINTTDTEKDDLLNSYIVSAKQYFYYLTGYYVGSQLNKTLTIYPEQIGTSYVEIFYMPCNFSSINSITVDDEVLDPSRYEVSTDDFSITFVKDGYYYGVDITKNMQISYTTGFATEDDIPINIQNIIALIAAFFYNYLLGENYKTTEVKSLKPEDILLPQELQNMIWQYKLEV